jgi:hypothetical protein
MKHLSIVGLYAIIKKSSKYRYQQPKAKSGEGTGGVMPFPVAFANFQLDYCVSGNSNDYRVEDLNFFVKCGKSWVRLS